jgi:hypothetical protein
MGDHRTALKTKNYHTIINGVEEIASRSPLGSIEEISEEKAHVRYRIILELIQILVKQGQLMERREKLRLLNEKQNLIANNQEQRKLKIIIIFRQRMR